MSMFFVAVSKLGCTELFFVNHERKLMAHIPSNVVLLKKQTLLVMRRIAGDTFMFSKTAHLQCVKLNTKMS